MYLCGVSGGRKGREEEGAVVVEGDGRLVDGGNFPGVRRGKSASKVHDNLVAMKSFLLVLVGGTEF